MFSGRIFFKETSQVVYINKVEKEKLLIYEVSSLLSRGFEKQGIHIDL